MQKFFLSIIFLFEVTIVLAQTRLQVENDSIRITNGELIIRNNTRDVQGYLYNTGNGLTQFKTIDALNGGGTSASTLTTAKIIGGITSVSALTLQPTSTTGITGADIIMKVGNNGSAEAMRISNSGNIGINGASSGAKLELTATGLGSSSSPTTCINLINTTPAAENSQQISPSIKWSSQGWNTTSSESFNADWMAYSLPVQGTINPTGKWVLASRLNNSGFSEAISLTGIGDLAASGTIYSRWLMGRNSNISTSGSFNTAIFAAVQSGYHYTEINQKIGGFNTTARVVMASASSIGIDANVNYVHNFIASGTVRKAASGTHTLFTSLAVKPIIVTTANAALTNASTLYIDGAPSAATNNYSLWVKGQGTSRFDSKIIFDYAYTPTQTTGAQTINKPLGSVNFAAGHQTLEVSNSMVTSNSIIMLTIEADDTAATSAYILEKSPGSFTIKLNAPAAGETRVNFFIFN